MNKYFILLIILVSTILSCEKSDTTDTKTQQVVITSDSSEVTGRLFVDVRNHNNTSAISNAQVRIYLTYDDMMKNIPLYDLNSSSSGRVDFGYILQGNYYLTGVHQSGGITIGDTTVAQILPRRSHTRFLFLK